MSSDLFYSTSKGEKSSENEKKINKNRHFKCLLFFFCLSFVSVVFPLNRGGGRNYMVWQFPITTAMTLDYISRDGGGGEGDL